MDATKTLKDAFYVAVGLGVLSVRQVRDRRAALRKQLETQLNDANQQIQKFTGEIVDKARQAAKDTQGQLQSLTTGGLNAVRNRTSPKAA